MQKVTNYGSFLQAHALKSTLERLGCECEFIDIKPGRQLPGYRRNFKLYWRKVRQRLLNRDFVEHIKYLRMLRRRFHDEFFFELGAMHRNNTEYDLVIIGSDEVFHFAQPTPWGFTTQLYGEVPEGKRVVSYAGSFGHTTLDRIKTYGLEDTLRKALRNMNAISVRDENSREVVESLIGRKPEQHLDPVFLQDYQSKLTDVPQSEYLLIYTYPNRISEPDEIRSIVDFARKNHKKIISIGFYFPWVDEVVVPHPFEVVSYFYRADYVVTDTFHGTILSIVTSANFATIIRESNTEKLSSLLLTMEQSDRAVSRENRIATILQAPADFTRTHEIIQVERKRALSYLADQVRH
ncbi:polysaccharide pyruvyl transferase family protein [Sulfitobacter sp. 915]|uniref:polysaccharide pyruvyl transferase family protein n=1 Tax=Sulfitobacter sp. 915 TaxID=3368558 RepID=UPI0037467AA0